MYREEKRTTGAVPLLTADLGEQEQTICRNFQKRWKWGISGINKCGQIFQNFFCIINIFLLTKSNTRGLWGGRSCAGSGTTGGKEIRTAGGIPVDVRREGEEQKSFKMGGKS